MLDDLDDLVMVGRLGGGLIYTNEAAATLVPRIELGVPLATFSGGALAALAGWQALLYAGLVSVGIGYTLQVVGQRGAHPAHAAIILSLETVFAAIGGVLLLGEHLDERAVVGCALMLAGMLISQIRLRWWWKSRRNKVPSQP